MNVTVVSGPLARRKEPFCLWLTEEPTLPPWARGWPANLRATVEKLLKVKRFHGKLNETLLIPVDSQWTVLIGLGKKGDLTLDRIRQGAGSGARRALGSGIDAFALSLSPVPRYSLEQVAQAVVEGLILGTYRYQELKSTSPEERKVLKTVTFVVESPRETKPALTGVRRGQAIAESVCWVRDMVNRPANRLTPLAMAQEAKAAGRKFGFRLRVLDRATMRRLGMNAVLAVAQGSIQPPQFIVTEYRAPGAPKRPILFAGKGITFDSGGLSLKPADKMHWMKYDMSGGAAVLGAMRAIAALKLPVHVVGLVPATENLPSGSAQRPGDVIRTYSGKTVEVENTDAEGRLVLADALGYAQRYQPQAIVDLATLTGACIVALGHHAVGLMGNDPWLLEQVRSAGNRSAERVWELPLWPEYGEQIKSEVADLKNVGSDGAGAITAGYFLKEFVEDVSWAHLDIAGLAWSESEKGYLPRGATGVGVRLLVELVTHWKQKSAIRMKKS